ncbi:MAG: hypothetical protein OXS33_11210 [bacterium]|nr:hypothetical protein [bacterium]
MQQKLRALASLYKRSALASVYLGKRAKLAVLAQHIERDALKPASPVPLKLQKNAHDRRGTLTPSIM